MTITIANVQMSHRPLPVLPEPAAVDPRSEHGLDSVTREHALATFYRWRCLCGAFGHTLGPYAALDAHGTHVRGAVPVRTEAAS